MVQVIWTQAATQDVSEIHEYIARDSRKYARQTVDRIHASTRSLRQFPERGELLVELSKAVYRQIVSGSYRVIYQINESAEQVFIVAVIHSSRDLKRAWRKRVDP